MSAREIYRATSQHMSHSPNSLKRVIWGVYRRVLHGVTMGDTRSLD